ncbi:calaxin-like [Uranotaenia lowii]|uniref:calaxin-like n=1 Tax=Uranotaenia lowii TaxID=190385 RepID=UPI002479BF0C|nr:calaxin-like [Uranotaenia lowii]
MPLDITLDPSEECRFLNKVHRLIRRMVRRTHFSQQELEACLLIYYKLVNDDDSPVTSASPKVCGIRELSRVQFVRFFDRAFGIPDETTANRIQAALTSTETAFLSMESWVRMLSIFLRGTMDEKIEHCFRVYDFCREGELRREHMMILLRKSFIKHHEEEVEETIKDMIEMLIRRLDVDRDGVISLEDFRESVKKNPELMECFGQAMPNRSYVYAFSRTFLDKVEKF